MRVVYLDGQFVPESDAKLSIYDLSVMQGAAAFEMTRSFNGEHFKLWEHVERLRKSCAALSMDCHWSSDDLFQMCMETAEMNDHGAGEEHRLLIVVSPGCAPMYRELSGVLDHPFVYIADFPLRYTVAGMGRAFTEGVHAVTSSIQQVPDACLPSKAKHRSRLHFHLAQQQVPTGTWPLLTDRRGWYTEAPGANIITVRPGLSGRGPDRIEALTVNALPGISMETVRELTGARQGTWTSRQPRPKECWLTGTPFCMLPVVSLDGKPIGDGTPGPVFKETLAKWSELVGVDIQGQIEGWDAERPDAN